MMLPFMVTLIPLYIQFRAYRLVGTYWPLILPTFFGHPFYIFLLRQFFLTIPFDLSDAAKIDGAGEFSIFYRIVLPLCKPVLSVVIVF